MNCLHEFINYLYLYKHEINTSLSIQINTKYFNNKNCIFFLVIQISEFIFFACRRMLFICRSMDNSYHVSNRCSCISYLVWGISWLLDDSHHSRALLLRQLLSDWLHCNLLNWQGLHILNLNWLLLHGSRYLTLN